MSCSESKLSVDEKYRLYESSVQCHESDIVFLNHEYKEEFGRNPLSLREDFGGTALLACEWVKQSEEHQSAAIDLDPEPIQYGKENHFARLLPEEKKRMQFIQGDVLADYEFKSDLAVAFNFSYSIFKKRADLLNYFRKVRKSLNKEGAFFIDLFGGFDARKPAIEETEYDDFSYFWDCDIYNPLTHEVFFAIHFKKHDEEIKHRNVFTYDWRLWGARELREVMEEAGFSKTHIFWEGDDDDDESGNGEFFKTDRAENCESWVSYIMGVV